MKQRSCVYYSHVQPRENCQEMGGAHMGFPESIDIVLN